MKFSVRQLRLHTSDPDVGSNVWRDAAGGRFTSAEADEDTRMVQLKGEFTLRIPFEAVASLVYKATPAVVKTSAVVPPTRKTS